MFLSGSNCTERFQLAEYGTLPDPFTNPSPANALMPRLFRKTSPFESVPRSASSEPIVPCKGALPVRRMGWVGSGVPPAAEPLATVPTLMKPPKSGFGLRLLPVSGACEMP